MQNLDAEINKLSYNMFEKINDDKNSKSFKTELKNLCEKSLGVLSQDGPYAYVVFVESKKAENEYLKPIFEDSTIKEIFGINGNDYTQEIQNLSQNLHQYLYFKEILEKILTYLRYHLKTLDK